MRLSEEAEWRAQQLSSFAVITLVLLLAAVLLGTALPAVAG